jgi:hypothetical protein
MSTVFVSIPTYGYLRNVGFEAATGAVARNFWTFIVTCSLPSRDKRENWL